MSHEIIDRAKRDQLGLLLASQRESAGVPTRSTEWCLRSLDTAIPTFQRYLRNSGRILRWAQRLERIQAWLMGKSGNTRTQELENDIGIARTWLRDALLQRDEMIARIELFLSTDLPYQWSHRRWRSRGGDKGAWPFLTWRDYKTARQK